MNIGTITCTYFMRVYNYCKPENFSWGDMCDKYRTEYSIADFMELASEIRSIGFDGLEIWEPMFSYKIYNNETAKSVSERLRAMGFKNLVYCIGGWSARDVLDIDSAYSFAHDTGCEVVAGCVIKQDADVVLPALQAAGEKYNMLYAIENHPAPNIEDPKDVETLCRPYSRVGANLDTGIYNMMGYDVLEAAEILKDKIYHCHFKDTPRGGSGCMPIGDSDTPCAALLEKFIKWQYKHMVSVEYEFPTDPTPGLIKSFGYISGAIKALSL